MIPAPVFTILLLLGSNIFMTFAWYGHLKYKAAPLITVILISWLIAFFEYCLQVPANRIGHAHFSAAELKTMQEVMSLTAFLLVAWLLFDQRPGPSQIAGFVLIAAGAFFIFKSPLG